VILRKSIKRPLSLVALSIILVIFVTSISAQIFAQSSSTIRAELCDSSPPDLSISQPLSDSIVDQPTVTVAGSAVRTSQIDYFVNNQYSSSTVVDDSDTFSSPISLTRGTNTVRLHAIYSCNNTTSDSIIVVSYEPSSVPSDGSKINTVTAPPSSLGPGIVSNPALLSLDQRELPGLRKSSFFRKSFIRIFDFARSEGRQCNHGLCIGTVIKMYCLVLAISIFISTLLSPKKFAWLGARFGVKKKLALICRKKLMLISLLLACLFAILLLI